jgi:hypothetical protein
MKTFNNKYAQIHTEIQENSELVSKIYSIVRANVVDDFDKSKRKYVHVGEFKDFQLGLDLAHHHNNHTFGEILAKMRLIYEISNGEVDLSKVYTRLDNNLAILSEDVAHGAELFVDRTPVKYLDLELLEKTFKNPDCELQRSTFRVRNKNKFRYPIIDLDHVSARKKYKYQVDKWAAQYNTDPRFHLKEIKK